MKKFYLLIIILTAFQINSKASHVAGAELTYQCLGNGNYQVTLTFYRDCFGIPPPLEVLLSIGNSCGIPDDTVNLVMINAPALINPLCSQNSTCNGGTGVGIQKCIYQGIITLPALCPNWILGVTMSARNGSILTIVDPTVNNLYISAGLSNENNLCNSSPVFLEDPNIQVCVNEPYCLNPGGYDADGDSLAYVLMPPMTSANEFVVFTPPYTYTQPLLSNPPVTINSRTGELCFTSIQPTVATYVIMILEYRNGILIGNVERDMILYGVSCAGAQPYISGINGTYDYDVSICANYPVCFSIYTNGHNTSDSTTLTWDNGIPNAYFSISDVTYDSAYFCWVPAITDIDSIPHCFTVNVKDNSCPMYQTNSKTFCITVHDNSVYCSPLTTGNLITSDTKLLIYPQPAADFINIDCGMNINEKNNYILTITDLYNKVYYHSTVEDKITSLNTVDQFSPGVYFAVIKDENGELIKKTKFIVIGKM